MSYQIPEDVSEHEEPLSKGHQTSKMFEYKSSDRLTTEKKNEEEWFPTR